MAWGRPSRTVETQADRLECIRAACAQLDIRRLKRVRDTRPEQWINGVLVNAAGQRCLVGHLEDWQYDPDGLHQNRHPLYEPVRRAQLMLAFDGLVRELAEVAAAAKLVRNLVLVELERRQQSADPPKKRRQAK